MSERNARLPTPGDQDHARIIPTARMVAYLRSFSDIPYAEETSRSLHGEEAAREIYRGDFDHVTKFAAPFAEARYRCFDRFIDRYNNVLELAVGTSVERGLSISNNGKRTYVGTDLPEMIAESKAFLSTIQDISRTNHHLEPANVLYFEQMNAAIRHFNGDKNLAIINEGLWMFLSLEERIVCAENIRKLLEIYGGKWITPDIDDLESIDRFKSSLGDETRSAMQGVMRRISILTGRDQESNHFSTTEEAIRFFQDAGFHVSQYPMIENLSSLRSVSKLWGEQERRRYETGLRQQRVWIMSLM